MFKGKDVWIQHIARPYLPLGNANVGSPVNEEEAEDDVEVAVAAVRNARLAWLCWWLCIFVTSWWYPRERSAMTGVEVRSDGLRCA